MANLMNGNRVREERERAGLTREQLALRASVSTSTIARIELKNATPSGVALIGIARALNVDVDSLVLKEEVA